MASTQVRHRIEDEAGGGAPGDDRQGDALRGESVPDQIERAEMGCDEHDPLASGARFAKHRQVFYRDGEKRRQFLRAQVFQAKELAEVPGRHAEDLPRLRLELGPRGLRSQDLTDIGDNICAVDGRRSDPEITRAVGGPIAEAIRRPGNDARDDIGDSDGKLVAQLARALAAKAVTGAAGGAVDGRFARRCYGAAVALHPGRHRSVRHSCLICHGRQGRHWQAPGARSWLWLVRAAGCTAWHRRGPADRGSASARRRAKH